MEQANFLKTMEHISGIKKQEVPLPITRKSAVVSPLLVGDDLTLRSSLTAPVNYDREMSKLLHSHTEIIVDVDKPFVHENFEKFCATTSNIDKTEKETKLNTEERLFKVLESIDWKLWEIYNMLKDNIPNTEEVKKK